MHNAILAFCFAFVGVLALYGAHLLLGEWSTLLYAGVAFLGLSALFARVNVT